VPIQAPRVLFKTGSFPDPEHFNTDFCSLSPELVDHLAQAGVVLVGLDTPSVDPVDSKALQAHNAIYRADMAILEGVVLDAIAPGVYTLIALPLKIEGGDASPVRAVLVDGSLA
jgi:arylformamidase